MPSARLWSFLGRPASEEMLEVVATHQIAELEDLGDVELGKLGDAVRKDGDHEVASVEKASSVKK